MNLASIGIEICELAYRPEPATYQELRQLRQALEEIEREADIAEMRIRQAEDLERGGEPVSWLGTIDTFAADLVFHAKRLGRDVRGLFNKIPLVATPTSTAEDIIKQWEKQAR